MTMEEFTLARVGDDEEQAEDLSDLAGDLRARYDHWETHVGQTTEKRAVAALTEASRRLTAECEARRRIVQIQRRAQEARIPAAGSATR